MLINIQKIDEARVYTSLVTINTDNIEFIEWSIDEEYGISRIIFTSGRSVDFCHKEEPNINWLKQILGIDWEYNLNF
jgi:hypothetical protein